VKERAVDGEVHLEREEKTDREIERERYRHIERSQTERDTYNTEKQRE